MANQAITLGRVVLASVLAGAMACLSPPAVGQPGASGTAANPMHPTVPGMPTELTSLDEWDQAMGTLRRVTWNSYAATAAYGKDGRGRSIADDLDEWVMTPADQEQLRARRLQAERQFDDGNSAAAIKILEEGRTALFEQTERILVIDFYWTHRLTLERQHALWLRWVRLASPEAAAVSRARLAALDAELVRDYSPTMTFEALWSLVDGVDRAYDDERLQLAQQLSEKAASGGISLAARERTLPCPDPAEIAKAAADRSEKGPTDAPAHIVFSPAADTFYPPEARRAQITGRTILSLRIAADGCMKSARVARSTGAPELDDAAIDLAERTTFLPPLKAGKPVEGDMEVMFAFQLTTDERPDSIQIPSTAAAEDPYKQGNDLLNRGQFEAAIPELSEAIRLHPADARALADRALAHAMRGELDLAQADAALAQGFDAHNAVVFRARGMIALGNKQYRAAATEFTRSLEINPGNEFALAHRAEAAYDSGDLARALESNAEAIRLYPKSSYLYTSRAFLMRTMDQPEEALELADKVVKANPNNVAAYSNAAAIYAACGRQEAAMEAYDRAFAIAPSEPLYLTREARRLRSDRAGRREDIEAALKLNPQSARASRQLVQLQLDDAAYDDAVSAATAALALHPADIHLLTRRGIAYAKSKQPSLAERDFDAATAAAKKPSELNTICWEMSTASVDLERALRVCDLALAKTPLDPDFLDSRALTLMRLGKDRLAKATYDSALRLRPYLISSLYGRGLVEQHLRDKMAAEADLQKAQELDAQTADRFASYGLRPSS